MRETEQLNLALQELGKVWGLEGFSYTEDEPTILVFNDNLVVHFKQSVDSKNLILFCNLGGAYPAGSGDAQKVERLEKILQLNFLLKDNVNGTLSISNSSAVIFSCQTLIETLTSQHLEAFLDIFVTQAEQLRTELSTEAKEQQEEALNLQTSNEALMLKI